MKKLNNVDIRTKLDLANVSKLIKAAGLDLDFGSVNNALINLYGLEGKELRTFKQWANDGYQIARGSKAYTIWSKKRSSKKESEEKSEEGQEFSFFGLAKLFSQVQVIKA